MVEPKYVPDAGDIVWITFSPQSGHEQSGRRPALVLSPSKYNEKTSLALFCPITSKVKNYPFEVALTPEVAVKGVVLADQIKSMDWRARKISFECQVPSRLLIKVLDKLNVLLDLTSFTEKAY